MIEVRMPNGAKELRIKHFRSMSHVPEEGFKNTQDSLLFLAEFLGLNYNQVLDFRKRDIDKMVMLALKALARMDLKSKLPEHITLGGQKFVLVNPEDIGIGWHIDFKSCSITKDPVRLACLFYVQEGYNYSDVDVNGNITHNIASRYELFEKEFPLDLFIRSSNFFLKRSLTSIKRSTVIEIARNRTKNRISSLIQSLNLLNGKLRLKRLWTRST
jgi:hypothetical protein